MQDAPRTDLWRVPQSHVSALSVDHDTTLRSPCVAQAVSRLLSLYHHHQMIDHLLGRPSPSWKRIQVCAHTDMTAATSSPQLTKSGWLRSFLSSSSGYGGSFEATPGDRVSCGLDVPTEHLVSPEPSAWSQLRTVVAFAPILVSSGRHVLVRVDRVLLQPSWSVGNYRICFNV